MSRRTTVNRTTAANQLKVSDAVWKRKVQDMYGDRLDSLEDKADFKTWKEYYYYIKYMMTGHCEEFEAERLVPKLDDDEFFEFWEDRVRNKGGNFDGVFKLPDVDFYKGDIISGYNILQFVGAKFIMNTVGDKLVPVVMDNDFDDEYVNVPRNFLVITEFPILYWDRARHSDVWFDPRVMDLQFTKDDIVVIEGTSTPEFGGDVEAYIEFIVNNIRYAITGYKTALEQKLDRINKLYHYRAVLRGEGIYEWLSDRAADFLSDNGIKDGQILYVDWDDNDDHVNLD